MTQQPDHLRDPHVRPRRRKPTGDWSLEAECRGMDPNLFFPDTGDPQREAKATCERCTVRSECLDHAMTNTETDGIWGGLNAAERRSLRRAKQRLAAKARIQALQDADTTPRARPAPEPPHPAPQWLREPRNDTIGGIKLS